jgi:uncharacterized cofD-like protein
MASESAIGGRVVSLGGGHGLAATLAALRRLTQQLTAIVTVADDGGSSGRLRAEFGTIPPGDLRMALAALCADDEWGSHWASVVQHRFHGDGPLSGHAVGNLLLTALWEIHGDPVVGLDRVAALLGVTGRVLPMAAVPLEIHAKVRGVDQGSSEEISTVRGQVAVASTTGEIIEISLEPGDPPARPEALAAIAEAEWITIGPGSWFSSVLAHLLVPEQRQALVRTRARKVLILNIDDLAHGGGGETSGYGADRLLEVFHQHAPELKIDVVLVDPKSAGDRTRLAKQADLMGADLRIIEVAKRDGTPHHDIDLLSKALAQVFTTGSGMQG